MRKSTLPNEVATSLTGQVDNAVRSGNFTGFLNAMYAIKEADPSANTNGVIAALNELSVSNAWKPDPGAASVASAIRSSGSAATASGAVSSTAATAIQKFVNDFNNSADVAVLRSDAQKVLATIDAGHESDPLVRNLLNNLSHGLAYADGGYKAGKDPTASDYAL